MTTILTAAAAAISQGAPIPVNACATELNVPGAEYILTNNLNCPSLAIRITADNVVFDLGGHTIAKVGTAQGSGIITAGPVGGCLPVKGVQVKNGTISNYAIAVSLCMPGGVPVKSGSQVKNMKFLDNTTAIAMFNIADTMVMNNEVTGSAGAVGTTYPGAIYLQNAQDNSVKNNLVRGAMRNGIMLTGGSRDNDIKSNLLTMNSDAGIRVDAGSQENDMRSNVARANGQYDMFDGNNSCGSNSWKNNTFLTRNQTCIQ